MLLPRWRRPLWIGLGLVLAVPLGRFMWQAQLASPMRDAVDEGKAADLRQLLAIGANPNGVSGGQMSDYPLMRASEKSHLEVMRVLIEAGADVNTRGYGGGTALMSATSPQAVRLLLEAGADPKARDEQGFTAWDYARREKLSALVRVLQNPSLQRPVSR